MLRRSFPYVGKAVCSLRVQNKKTPQGHFLFCAPEGNPFPPSLRCVSHMLRSSSKAGVPQKVKQFTFLGYPSIPAIIKINTHNVCLYFYVHPRGIEPLLRDPQSRVLSVERRVHINSTKTITKNSIFCNAVFLVTRFASRASEARRASYYWLHSLLRPYSHKRKTIA